jgi:hypothetical protein
VCLDGDRPEYLARRAVTAVLARLAVSPERRDEAELAVSELVANAGRHAPGPRELRVRVCAEAVTFAVADGGDDHAVIARVLASPGAGVEWFEEHGRGLQIVAALFPGACGARACGGRPAGTGRGSRGRRRAAVNGDGEPAKEVWISVALS